MPDAVEINTLVEFRNFLQDDSTESNLNDELSSYEMKMVGNNNTVENGSNLSFWACDHCTYHNPMNFNTCQMCALPHNVCVNQCQYFILNKNLRLFYLYNICKKKTE